LKGKSGILTICPRDERPLYVPSKRRLEWPNGARSLIFTADEPERLRGAIGLVDLLVRKRMPRATARRTI